MEQLLFVKFSVVFCKFFVYITILTTKIVFKKILHFFILLNYFICYTLLYYWIICYIILYIINHKYFKNLKIYSIYILFLLVII